MIANLLDEVELCLAPVHVLFLVLEVFLHNVVGGLVFAEVVHAVAQQFDAFDRDLVVELDVLARVIEELALGPVFVLQFATKVKQTADELIDPAHFLIVVPHIFGTEFLKALVCKDLALQFVAESLIGEVGYKKL